MCKDAGKSEKEYTSHWVKTNDRLTGKSITICPTLLSQECRYCREFGHTAKYCQILADNNKYDKESLKPTQKQPTYVHKKTTTPDAKKVSFDVLAYDSDEDSDEEAQAKPQPCVAAAAPKPMTAAKPVLTGWAAIVAKPVPVTNEPLNLLSQLTLSLIHI